MATDRTPGQQTPRRVGHELTFMAWGVLLLLSILLTIATAGIGAFTTGIVVVAGIVLAVLGARRR